MFKRQDLVIPHIIHGEILRVKKTKSLHYPSIVTILCEEERVDIGPQEDRFGYKAAFDATFSVEIRSLSDPLSSILEGDARYDSDGDLDGLALVPQ